jgi:folate-binding protein YgfZ
VAEAAGLIERAGFKLAEPDEYDRLRILEGIPDGSRDLEIERSTLLENGFDELHGVDWQKGCYMGQELTARIKYRGLVKKRLLPVRIEGPVPPAMPFCDPSSHPGRVFECFAAERDMLLHRQN